MLDRRIPTLLALTALAAALQLVQAPASAEAQTADENTEVNSNAKGIIGLGLIGAELGFVIPTAAGLKETWSLIVFPVVGAVGGGLAGHFLIEENNETELAVAALAVGLALIVPATVLTVHFTSYDPSDDQAPPPNAPPGVESAEGGAEARVLRRYLSPRTPSLRPADVLARTGLFQLAPTGLSLGVPSLSLRQNLDIRQSELYGIDSTTEVHLPVVSGRF